MALDLSIIIVSYNVKHFLEHCLLSLEKAIEGLQAEVIVIDNDSSDETDELIARRFQWVRFLVNPENVGYSKANNQALSLAEGEYILFLNPDAILAEDCLQKCLEFMKANPQAGALGVRMIDGSGRFLPESKRGFPGAWNSFTKMSGLASAFPSSHLFAGYYLGHLPEDKEQVVDVLSGAYFFTRKSLLEQTGGFDERFFMFGEDIDLSIRIQQTGFQNYYIPYTTIIHFKGESTAKDSIYLRNFYGAMSLFVEKHYTGSAGSLKRVLLKFVIKVRLKLASLQVRRSHHAPQLPASAGYKLIGDSLCAGRAAVQLSTAKINTAMNAVESNQILCVGSEFSYKSMILHMMGNPGMRYLICSTDSSNLISSHSSFQQGVAIPL